MNLPNKITMARIFLSIALIIMLVFPYEAVGVSIPEIVVGKSQITISITYLIGGILLLNMRLKHINYQYNNNSEVVALNK